VHGVTEQLEPRIACVRELVGIAELLRPCGPQEQRLQRVKIVKPVGAISLDLRHRKPAVAKRVSARQTHRAWRIHLDQARQSSFRDSFEVSSAGVASAANASVRASAR